MPKAPTLPFFKSYPEEWLHDDKASALSLKSFGAWFKIINLMWLSGSGDGVLEGNVRGLRRILGAESDDDMREIIKDMVDCEVGAIEQDGNAVRFYSPRLKKEWSEARGRRETRKQYDEKRRGTDELDEPIEQYVKPTTLQRATPKINQYEGDDAIDLFKHYTGYNPPIAHADLIKHRCKNLKMWDATVQAWKAEGYKVTNVVNMIEKYEADVSPKAVGRTTDRPAWKVNEERLQTTIRRKSCVICGSTGPDVGGSIGDERCDLIKCQAAPPPEKKRK